jgi:hypothetical protein
MLAKRFDFHEKSKQKQPFACGLVECGMSGDERGHLAIAESKAKARTLERNAGEPNCPLSVKSKQG